jgi:hypothetical protein
VKEMSYFAGQSRHDHRVVAVPDAGKEVFNSDSVNN